MMGVPGMNESGSGQGQVAGCFEQSDDPSGFIKFGKRLDQQRHC